ncbi:50S ribosomal protein L13 [Patescibacteria group bacterium]|nr:50S ribosomal protein L13 [Patescibacteria group bacterium]
MTKARTKIKIEREHHHFDASGKIAGRLATPIAILLMGKHKVSYQPHLDMGDFVEVENVSKLKLSGKKAEQKYYYRASGYPGGLKKIPISRLLKEKPQEVFRKTVFCMLPKNKLRKEMIKRLTFKIK